MQLFYMRPMACSLAAQVAGLEANIADTLHHVGADQTTNDLDRAA